MAIRFLTDSTSDILPQEAARRDIDVVPLKVLFGDSVYRDGLDLDHPGFYRMLAQCDQFPTTSQPTPDDFLPAFERAKANGDQLICLLLASSLSGTCQSAFIARELCGWEHIHIIDSTQTAIGLRLLLDLGCRLRDEGCSAREIADELEQAKGKVRLMAIVDTLEYLHKGGRLPGAVTVVGSLLKVKPIIALRDGAISVVGKGVGVKGSLSSLLRLMEDLPLRDDRIPVCYGFTGDDALCRQLVERSEETFGPHSHQVQSIGTVIGAHAGPNAAAVAYLSR